MFNMGTSALNSLILIIYLEAALATVNINQCFVYSESDEMEYARFRDVN